MIIVAKVRSTSNAKKGGLFVGKSHDDGGMPAIVVNNGQPIEVEGGEVIINKEAVKKHWKTLSAINQSAGNGVPIPPPSDYTQQIEKMEHGGNISLKAINEGTRIEMEHKDTIKKIKKGNISLESVARSIAKDHLKENPNYYNIISKLKLKKGGSVVCRRCGEDWDESDVENGYTCTSCGCDNIRFYKTGGDITSDEKESIYEEWKSLVNMSSDELKEFYDSEEGKIAGLSSKEANELGIDNGRKSARWILKMKSINHNDWTPNMWRWAKKQISFIKRMSGVDGDLYNENGKKTPKYLALLIWGNNPEKFANGGVISDEIERLKTLPYNQLLMLIRDSYKDLNAEIGVKGHYPNGEPIIGYLPYQYDFMYTSSKSNKKIRFYIDLGDEYFVHPSELSSKFNPSEQKRIELKADEFKRESDEVFNKIIAELKSNSELEIVKEGLKKALNNGFKIENQYDGNDYFNSFGDSILVKEKIARIKLDKYISRSSDINLKTDINKLDLVRFKDFESNLFKKGGEINSDMENIKYTGNIQTDLISVLSKTYRGVTFIAENAFDETDITNAKYLSVPFVVDPDNEDNVFYLGKQFKLPSKKPVNVAWVEEQINKDSVYKNFSDKFSELLSSRGFSKTSINVYPTTYGIGVAIFFGDKEKVKNSIESLLNEYGIEYKTEYSEARWVYRYKISKSASNISKLSQASPKQFKDGGSILTIPEQEKIYSEYKALVNIPSEELASYMNSRDARREALTPAEIKKYGIKKGKHYIKQILILNETPVDSWTDENYAKAKEITDFICKFTQENREWYSVNGSISTNYRALMLFGHDCERYEGGGSIKQNKISKVMHEFREGKLYSSNGKLVVLPKQALAIALSEAGVEKKEEGGLIGDGDCYVIAGKIALNNTKGLKGIDFIGELYLVHAEVTGQGEISGIRYGHAWIEDNELVYDFSNGNEIILPKTLYYSVARVVREEPKYYRYTFKEAQDKMLSSGHYGYWDLKTETGL